MAMSDRANMHSPSYSCQTSIWNVKQYNTATVDKSIFLRNLFRNHQNRTAVSRIFFEINKQNEFTNLLQQLNLSEDFRNLFLK